MCFPLVSPFAIHFMCMQPACSILVTYAIDVSCGSVKVSRDMLSKFRCYSDTDVLLTHLAIYVLFVHLHPNKLKQEIQKILSRLPVCFFLSPLYLLLSAMTGVAKEFAQDFLALMEEKKVPQAFRDFLLEENCLTVSQFAAATTKEERVDAEVIEASGKTLKWGEKIAVRLTWTKCREMSGLDSGSGGTSSAASKSRSKMPDGSETYLRKAWKDKHSFNMLGNWLVNEDLMAKIYEGVHASPKMFFVPDMTSICRKSNLAQKPLEGTLITSTSVEKFEAFIEPCTTHPEWFMRFRAFLMTVCWCTVGMTPDFLTFETALAVCDFIFEAVNCRPDGKRPTVSCLNSCFLAMLGEYASLLQNEGKILEDYLKQKAIWEHFWKESIVSFENGSGKGGSGAEPSGVRIPGDIVGQVKGQDRLLKSLQGNLDRGLAKLNNRLDQSQGHNQGGKIWGQGTGKNQQQQPGGQQKRKQQDDWNNQQQPKQQPGGVQIVRAMKGKKSKQPKGGNGGKK